MGDGGGGGGGGEVAGWAAGGLSAFARDGGAAGLDRAEVGAGVVVVPK